MTRPDSSGSAPIRVLHIEDDAGTALLVRLLLESEPGLRFDITHCTTLTDGLETWRQAGPFDVVLLDLSLPDSHDLNTVRKFVQGAPGSNVIVMTGQERGSIGIESVKAGAQDFLAKGDDMALVKSIRYSLERQSILARLAETQHLARIGSFEFEPDSDRWFFSDEVFAQFEMAGHDPLAEELAPLRNAITQAGLSSNSRDIISVEFQSAAGKKYFDVLVKRNYRSTGGFVLQGYIQNITERKQSEELRKANTLALESAKMREKFIASVSHEMRTPLNAIYGMGNLLAGTPLNSEQTSYLNAILESSKLLLGIINDILDVSALQYGDIKIEQGRVAIREMLANLMSAMAFKKKEKNIELLINISPDVPTYIYGDGLRINQILFNLMGNAIKYTERGQVGLNVTVVDKRPDSCLLQFAVHDTGIGIPQEHLPYIFDTFKRVESNERLYEGAGLGLAIVKNLVELLKGQIDVESQLGRGSVFTVRLPVGISVGSPAEAEAGVPPDEQIQTGNWRILLVEDNKMNLLVAQKTLKRCFPHAVIDEAEHGGVAVQKLQNAVYDLVLMDLQMPVVDGYEATKVIRTELPSPANTTPVIAMTANAFVAKEQEDLFELGFDYYLLKPFHPDDLKSVVVRYARRS